MLQAVSDASEVVSRCSVGPTEAMSWPLLSTRKTTLPLASRASRSQTVLICWNSSSYITICGCIAKPLPGGGVARWDANRRFDFSLQLAAALGWRCPRCVTIEVEAGGRSKMTRIVALGAVIALFGCYSNNAAVKAKLVQKGDPNHPLYVGHTNKGELVLAATHYDAMNGLAVMADEVGQKIAEGMICRREMLTGTHVPTWVCRFQKEVDEEQRATQDWMDKPRNCIARCGNSTTAH